ncbi:maleylpyruvate isomerase N-terminal domain-containing protein [Ornithinimicrobium sp. F0845]|uniref:maleylpyruvate isomerase N-terminal domain-containing protein n=1 Tax=Ornithinimicrobium sp. F0845 TaxID=2926412 RepID=UPI001FF366CF|nr:maleylpyruvate isomerase N-terminal domain-containing protein [Ornithinimicrobium sp. F0845]MCK0111569.1 maleylpyruvate isomerase N-terminal domain-containing protein [Ornithinimicrobium sp. F0845]
MEHRSVEPHVAGLRAAVDAFGADAAGAGLEAKVPTAPAWTVRKLLAHQGMVHRWARANLRGESSHPPTWNAEGQAVADPVGWLVEGAEALVSTLEEVPDDVKAMVFLKDAPPPRLFWARRQCHETTIHAVDARAARLGRPPLPEDTQIADAVALDGIDEVLTGFITRGSSRFSDVGPVRVRVRPTGHDQGWSVLVRDGAAVTTRVGTEAGADDDGADRALTATGGGDVEEVRLSGSPVGLYLALWNRTVADAVEDPAGFLDTWRDRVRVRWS